MRPVCLVSVLPAVDSGQLALCLEKQRNSPARKQSLVPTTTCFLATNKTTHLKYMSLYVYTTCFVIFGALHCRKTDVFFGTTALQVSHDCA